ncbi:MAG: large conductance mechanosensitive channel protein MscL [Bacillota bacterium]|nr:large conductance mechanosensitive channel protein MscL [Bacillota bacterium]
MKKVFGEFRAFILRGNVMDLAIAVIIGAAFQSIVSSLVTNIISPIIGIFGKANFDYLIWHIHGVDIKYGAFLTAVINFLIIAFVIFLMVKGMNRISRINKRTEEAPKNKNCPYCCREIDINASRCPHCTSQLDN